MDQQRDTRDSDAGRAVAATWVVVAVGALPAVLAAVWLGVSANRLPWDPPCPRQRG